MQLSELLNIEELDEEVANGYVELRRHSTLPLTIYCYSRAATYDDRWNDVTETCRGLIVDDNGVVVSRPFRKFFNYGTATRPETWLENIPVQSPIVLDKLDGSLGILWEYQGQTGVASKGSFISDHANWATEWYHKNCPNPQWPTGFTPVFEMICQCVQRHVVTYNIPDQLILLALVNKETGEEADYNNLYHYAYLNGLKVADIFSKTLAEAATDDRDNKEGYVLTWPRIGQAPLKIKAKHETFLKLQRIVHNATPKTILEALSNKDYAVVDSWADDSSPELADFIRMWSSRFTETYVRIILEARKVVNNAAISLDTRKDIAAVLLTPHNKAFASISFAILDAKDPSRDAWKYVYNKFKSELSQRVAIAYDEDEV